LDRGDEGLVELRVPVLDEDGEIAVRDAPRKRAKELRDESPSDEVDSREEEDDPHERGKRQRVIEDERERDEPEAGEHDGHRPIDGKEPPQAKPQSLERLKARARAPPGWRVGRSRLSSAVRGHHTYRRSWAILLSPTQARGATEHALRNDAQFSVIGKYWFGNWRMIVAIAVA